MGGYIEYGVGGEESKCTSYETNEFYGLSKNLKLVNPGFPEMQANDLNSQPHAVLPYRLPPWKSQGVSPQILEKRRRFEDSSRVVTRVYSFPLHCISHKALQILNVDRDELAGTFALFFRNSSAAWTPCSITSFVQAAHHSGPFGKQNAKHRETRTGGASTLPFVFLSPP